MDKNLVSVIIPMYNSNDTIINSIKSVLKQTYKNYEIIIVDDGSTDNSYKIVEEFMQENNLEKKIKLLSQENRGPSAARNKGISHSRGEYIAFLDADDIWVEEKLEKQIKLMSKNSNIALVGSNINNNFYKKQDNILNISYNMLLFKNYFFTPTVIIKKSILDKVGLFDLEQKFSEDYNLWLRICKDYNCVFINESLAICGSGKPTFGFSGLSSKLWEMEKGELNNYWNLKKNNSINSSTFLGVSIFSLLKYVRRIFLTQLRKLYRKVN